MEIVKKDGVEKLRKKRKKYNIEKEELRYLYVDEGKSMVEISKVYECSYATIKCRLKEFKNPIRYYGSFLVNDNNETLHSKYVKGEISHSKYINEWTKIKGHKNWNEYIKKMNYESEKCLPMNKNKECAQYLGIYICENKEFLSKILNIVECMPITNPGYDVVCEKDKKIDVKCSCLDNYNRWNFNIRKNKIADYFLMIAFDNRENLNVIHIWLVNGNANVGKNINYYFSNEFILNTRDAISINKCKKS